VENYYTKGLAIKCKVCRHPKRDEIDRDLLSGHPLKSVAVKYGIPYSALGRHRRLHLSKHLFEAMQRFDEKRGIKLVDMVAALVKKADELLSKAEKKKDLRVALLGLRELRGSLELFGRATGELDSRGGKKSEEVSSPLFELPDGTRVNVAVALPPQEINITPEPELKTPLPVGPEPGDGPPPIEKR